MNLSALFPYPPLFSSSLLYLARALVFLHGGGGALRRFFRFHAIQFFFLGLILETLRIGGYEISSNIIIHVDGMGGGDQGEEEGRVLVNCEPTCAHARSP